MYEIHKGHILTGWVFLEAFMKFETEFEADMKRAGMDEMEIKRTILNVKLMKIPRKEWTTNDDQIKAHIITYVIYLLSHNMERLDKIISEVDKRAKAEVIAKTMHTDEYMTYRRTQFELRRIIQYCWTKRPYCELTFQTDGRITIS